MGTLHIRDARDDERDIMRDITLAAYEEYAAVMPEPLWLRYRKRLLETLDGTGPVERILAERDGVIVGSVMLFPPASSAYAGMAASVDCPEIRLLAVPPAGRGQGVGQGLMDECLRRAKASGARTIGLHTTDVMRAAMRMYERMEFVRSPELDFSPAEGVLVMGFRRDL